MQISLSPLTIILAMITVVLAASDSSSPWVWSGKNFYGGCSPAACTWQFNMTAPAYSHFPGFSASCSGNTLQNNDGFVPCTVKGGNPRKLVSARLGEFIYGPDQLNTTLYISYNYTERILPNTFASYNFTAIGSVPYGRFSAGNYSFDATAQNITINTYPA